AQYKVNVKQLFKANENLFANGLEELGQTNLVKHMIKTGDVKLIKQISYYLALSKQEFVHEELNKLKEKGLIRESFSPWAFSIVLKRSAMPNDLAALTSLVTTA
ncbi:1239_t:CDS:2, partial [Cetraspora pellucida]